MYNVSCSDASLDSDWLVRILACQKVSVDAYLKSKMFQLATSLVISSRQDIFSPPRSYLLSYRRQHHHDRGLKNSKPRPLHEPIHRLPLIFQIKRRNQPRENETNLRHRQLLPYAVLPPCAEWLQHFLDVGFEFSGTARRIGPALRGEGGDEPRI
jgi:hypothetical protein